METSREEGMGPGSATSSAPHSNNTTPRRANGKSDLLMRFFESDFFDAWIAVTYLHKTLTPGMHNYLCSRLYTLPDVDVERYLSQLCQLCVSRPDPALEDLLAGLCAQSLRAAVKTYWLLLAISQDNPNNEHVGLLRDRCEQAALEGHWDLPFKDSKLPAVTPRGQNRFFLQQRSSTRSDDPESSPRPIVSGSLRSSNGIDILRGSSPDPVPRLSMWRSGALSPDVPSRAMSPDGLGEGIFSSVFMDTGVEGLIYESGTQLDIRDRRHHLESASTNDFLTEGESGSEATTPQPNGGGARGRGRASRTPRSDDLEIVPTSPFSPPTSPRRRETTLGATLDFVEALCTASSNLTAFQPEDRQWALHKALHSINVEMNRASASGVAIWFPMGTSSRQRVVRLAHRESRLLNSREKAPFTLYIEVLNEAAAEAEAAQAAGEAAMPPLAHPPPTQEMALDPAAAEAAAEGIPWMSHHHRRNSSHETITSSVFAAAAIAAVQGSSAAAKGPTTPSVGDEHSPGPAAPLTSATSLVGLLVGDGAGSPAKSVQGKHDNTPGGSGMPLGSGGPSLISQRSDTSTFATDLSLADFASEASHSPPMRRPVSGSSGSTLPEDYTNAVGAVGAPLPHGLPPSPLPPLPKGQAQGGGTWIGAPSIKVHQGASPSPSPLPDLASGLTAALAGLRGEAPLVAVRLHVQDDVPVNSNAALSAQSSISQGSADGDGLPIVGGVNGVSEPIKASRLAVHPEPSSVLAAAQSPACARSGWMCRLGLCKSCNSQSKAAVSIKADGVDAEVAENGVPLLHRSVEIEPLVTAALPQGKQPRVRVLFTVQGGLDLAIKRSGPRHQRMPSYEALLHVAREHQLTVPDLLPDIPDTPTPSLPPSPHLGAEEAQRRRDAEDVYGEKWDVRRSRLREASPHGTRPGWDVRCVIVKSGDDCRQELLAMQLISVFHDVFTEARLPLWLRPYEVLVTSNLTALIEMVPNAPSIHAVKAASPPGTSLRDHFAAKFVEGSPAFKRAQRAFVESMAAYSLVSYLLQIRDRHNGNLLLDDAGHVIHIDFGFMLSNSPGGVNFESAPFKLTREMLEVMDSDSEGRPSELFDYFKVLLIQGFLAARKHSDRITLLVDMMSTSGCPCFKSKVGAVQGLKKRFALGLPEPAVVEVVLGLISDSLDAWRTRQYDYYQRILNGILS